MNDGCTVAALLKSHRIYLCFHKKKSNQFNSNTIQYALSTNTRSNVGSASDCLQLFFSKTQFIDPSDNSVATGVFVSLFRQRHFNKKYLSMEFVFLCHQKQLKSSESSDQPKKNKVSYVDKAALACLFGL